jgi:hypothetical protein
MIIKEDFFNAIHDYLEQITEDNFSSMYDGLKAIVLDYNKRGMGKELIGNAYNVYFKQYGDSMTLYQDEVFCEIGACMDGFCTPYKQIHLLD